MVKEENNEDEAR